MDEKFGTMIIDGKIINLDTISEEELDKLIKKLGESINSPNLWVNANL